MTAYFAATAASTQAKDLSIAIVDRAIACRRSPTIEEIDWSGRQDSNLRPLAPHASALPGCATPRPRGRMIAQMALGNANSAAQNLDKFLEFQAHLMDQLLTLIQIHLSIVAGESIARTANGEALLI
jgi:hypothetical protein